MSLILSLTYQFTLTLPKTCFHMFFPLSVFTHSLFPLSEVSSFCFLQQCDAVKHSSIFFLMISYSSPTWKCWLPVFLPTAVMWECFFLVQQDCSLAASAVFNVTFIGYLVVLMGKNNAWPYNPCCNWQISFWKAILNSLICTVHYYTMLEKKSRTLKESHYRNINPNQGTFTPW